MQIVHTFPQILTLSVKKSKNSAKFSSKSSRKNFIFHSANEISFFILQNFDAAFLLKNCDWSGAKECESCRSRKMLKNAPTLAIVAVHTEENEPPKVLKPKISFISFGSLPFTISPCSHAATSCGSAWSSSSRFEAAVLSLFASASAPSPSYPSS